MLHRAPWGGHAGEIMRSFSRIPSSTALISFFIDDYGGGAISIADIKLVCNTIVLTLSGKDMLTTGDKSETE